MTEFITCSLLFLLFVITVTVYSVCFYYILFNKPVNVKSYIFGFITGFICCLLSIGLLYNIEKKPEFKEIQKECLR